MAVYLALFFSTLIFDGTPVIMPPGWLAMLFFHMKYHMELSSVLLLGVAGSTTARYLQSLYMPKVFGKFLKNKKQEELKFLGQKLKDESWHRWLFVFFYAMTPLPDTVLFTAAGIAKVKPWQTVPPFYCGKFIGDAVIILSVRYLVGSVRELRHGAGTRIQILVGAVSAVVMLGVLFIDWRSLLERGKFRINFRVWR